MFLLKGIWTIAARTLAYSRTDKHHCFMASGADSAGMMSPDDVDVALKNAVMMCETGNVN